MRTPLLAILTVCLVLSGCARIGQSRLNPFNWFGRSTSETVSVTDVAAGPNRSDLLPLVAQVSEMRIDRAPGGAIVHAVGLPSVQGYWAAELSVDTSVEASPGTLVLKFLAVPPVTRTAQGTTQSREITAALFLSDQDLANVGTIVVRGAQNQRSSRRR